MDDFSIYGSSFENCLENLEMPRQILSSNWEKYHFMVNEGIVLEHKIYAVGLEVDQAKVAFIETLMSPTTVKGIRTFLGHVGFYRRFIKDFSKISRSLCRLLEKEANFEFDEKRKCAFEEIKARLIRAPIMATPDWNKEFEIMCDASDYAMGDVLDKELTRPLELYIMLARLLMKHKRIIQPLKKKC